MSEEKVIYGNISSVRSSLIEYMKTFIGGVYSPGSLVPSEVTDMMTESTCETNKETAVFLDRRNRVAAIAIGDDRSVPLPELEGRRSESRLSGIRCLHTHPNGTVRPSEIDIRSLRSMRYDAMTVIGVDVSRRAVTGISVSVLKRDRSGALTDVQTKDAVPLRKAYLLDSIFNEILETDKAAPGAHAASYENSKDRERAILVGVTLNENAVGTSEEQLTELKELADTAGAETAAYFTQRRKMPDPGTYIGSGLAKEISLKRQELDADLIIFDDELSASQIRNLENITGARVIDRTALILDIFAAHAVSREGRLQVELAQLKYRLPRLMGQGTSMSRLGGGIGTRGPGETQLETDRRHIRRRINYLEAQLREVKERRSVLRKERKRKLLPVVSVVGYTNAGKSTLVNALCNSDVLVEDKLFATLDTSVRRLVTPESRDFLLIDTVGFIRKLPHDLVEAFKSTLEEAATADLILHVADVSNPDVEECIDTVEKILSEIGAGEKPAYLVLNKTDKGARSISPDIRRRYGKVFSASALTGEGLDALREGIVQYFVRADRSFECILPYDKASLVSYLHDNGSVDAEEYCEDGIYVSGRIPHEFYAAVKKYEK